MLLMHFARDHQRFVVCYHSLQRLCLFRLQKRPFIKVDSRKIPSRVHRTVRIVRTTQNIRTTVRFEQAGRKQKQIEEQGEHCPPKSPNTYFSDFEGPWYRHFSLTLTKMMKLNLEPSRIYRWATPLSSNIPLDYLVVPIPRTYLHIFLQSLKFIIFRLQQVSHVKYASSPALLHNALL